MTTDLLEKRIALKLADMIGDPRYAGWSMQERKSQAVKRLRQDLENELRLAIHDLEYYGAPNLIKKATKPMKPDLFEKRISLKLADMVGDSRYAGWSEQEKKAQAMKRLRQDLENELRTALYDLEYYGAPNLIKVATKASATLTLFNSVYR